MILETNDFIIVGYDLKSTEIRQESSAPYSVRPSLVMYTIQLTSVTFVVNLLDEGVDFKNPDVYFFIWSCVR